MPLKSPSPPKPESPTRIPGRFYAFVIAGLATFLVALAVGWSPSTLYTVRARVLLERPGPAGTWGDKSVSPTQITSDRSLNSAAHQVGLWPPDDASSSQSAAVPGTQTKQLRQRMALVETDGEDEGQTVVDIQFTDTRRETALKLANHLASQFADQVVAFGERERHASETKRRRAKAQLAESHRDLKEAKSALNQYVDDRLGRMAQAQEDAMTQHQDQHPAADGLEEMAEGNREPDATEPVSEPPSDSPEDERLKGSEPPSDSPDDEQLKAWEPPSNSSEDEPTEDRPPDEPFTEEHNATESGRAAIAETEPPVRKTRLQLLVEIRSLPEYHEHYQGFAAQRQRYEQDRLDAQLADAPVPLPSARVLETAQVIRHRGAAASGTGLVVLGLIAGIIAWRFALLAHRLRFPLTFTSVKDVVQSLQIEAFGTISTTDGHDHAKRQQRVLRLVRLGTRAGEITLAAVVVLLMFMSIVDRPFIGHLVGDPFSAYSYAVRWVAEGLLS